ncbi:hypothetical protein B0H16DRAFT_1524444 [Mycena metata]|uniref:F-box domain-containing protein n=1 Tax=Mycena metata TaxID=1033252 RepID=A0AAD7NLF2_9AGAR|nr:hypothetical protein B0H16DRAFT_1524444 [Mycena metata]
MSIELLVPDLLLEIFFRLPSTVNQKITITQVSQFWRNVGLDNHLFWSSFSAGPSERDCVRVPLIIERSGSSTMLHVEFDFSNGNWPADTALRALVPHVARIEALDVECGIAVDTDVLLSSNLHFPALQTLRLRGWEGWHPFATVSLTAPRLRSLDLRTMDPLDLNALLAPGLESVRMQGVGSLKTLAAVFKQCRLVSHVAFYPRHQLPWTGGEFQGLTKPLAPALRDLELGLTSRDLVRLLNFRFSDVILHRLAAKIPFDSVEMLTALLSGVGPLAVFERSHWQRIELHDDVGRVRSLECWEGATSFPLKEVWDHLSFHHGLRETVREIRIPSRDWGLHLDVLESCPPKLQDGITIGIYISSSRRKGLRMAGGILRLPGLAKIEICGPADELSVEILLEVVAKFEPPEGRMTEVCVGEQRLTSAEENPFVALQMALGERCKICTHCTAKS